MSLWIVILEAYLIVGFIHNFTVMVVRWWRNDDRCPDIPLWWEIPVLLIQVGLFVAGWIIWPLVMAVTIRSILRWSEARKPRSG